MQTNGPPLGAAFFVTAAAAWLHDTVEDCGVALEDLTERFGTEVAGLVAEPADHKALPKAAHKRFQVVNAPTRSHGAALVKLCDKLSNVRSLAESPPARWPIERRRAYLDWAQTVVAALPGRLPDSAPRVCRADCGVALGGRLKRKTAPGVRRGSCLREEERA